jgi:hypothetical protein
MCYVSGSAGRASQRVSPRRQAAPLSGRPNAIAHASCWRCSALVAVEVAWNLSVARAWSGEQVVVRVGESARSRFPCTPWS